MRYKITLSYSGAPYCGWQSQDNAPTVQGEVERALALLLGGPVKVTGAGRTDTGVNALAYPAHFDTDIPIDATYFLYKLNAIVGKGIVFHSIERRHDGFHARFDATKRTYNYFIHRKKDPFVDEFSYFYPYGLDIAAMNEAAALLKGEMDFSAFEKTGPTMPRPYAMSFPQAGKTMSLPICQRAASVRETTAIIWFSKSRPTVF